MFHSTRRIQKGSLEDLIAVRIWIENIKRIERVKNITKRQLTKLLEKEQKGLQKNFRLISMKISKIEYSKNIKK